MRRGILMVGASLIVATATVSGAEVNCKQVNKYLQTGRSVKDVAETMVVDEADVKKCQEAAGQAGDAKPGDKAGGEAKEGAK